MMKPCLAQPHLVIREKVKKAPAVHKGDVVSFTFAVENTGTEPVRFDSVQVACDCTGAQLPPPLSPGQTATVTVTFDTGHAYGRQDRDVVVFTNDPGGPVRLRFKVNVRPTKTPAGATR
jgi:hypothetical protein